MTDPIPSAFEEMIRDAVSQPLANPEFVNSLWTELAHSTVRRPTLGEKVASALRPAWRVAIPVALVLVILYATVGPQRVMAAVQTLFDYLPGVGAVQNLNRAKVLGKPVQLQQNGITVTVENLTATQERTWLRLKVEGWAPDPHWADTPEGQNHEPILSLPGQAAIVANNSDVYLGNVLFAEYQFAPLPSDADQVTLLLDQLPHTAFGSAPQDWRFTLTLRQATAQDMLPDAGIAPLSSPSYNGIRLSIVQVFQDADQTLLTIRLDTPTLNDSLDPAWTSQLSLRSLQGQIYPLTLQATQGDRTATFRTRAFHASQDMTLRLEQMFLIESQPTADSAPAFIFDPGPDAQIGKHWALNQVLESGRFRLHVVGADLETTPDSEPLLVFSVDRPGNDVRGVMLDCSSPLCLSAQTDDLALPMRHQFQPTVTLKGLPQEHLKISLGNLYYTVTGPWEAGWHAQGIPAPSQTATSRPSLQPLSTMVPSPTTPAQPDSPVALLQKNYRALYGQPGWVYVRSESIEPENSPDYQNETFGPAHAIDESWQYIDADGLIQQQVWIETSPDGRVWHKIARDGPTQVDFIAGTSIEDPSMVVRPQADPLSNSIENAQKYHLQFSQEKTTLEDRSCWLVRLATVFDPPTTIAPHAKQVSRSETRTWIDRETGQILQFQTVFTFVDGEEQAIQTMRYHIKERIDTPPQEILDLLKQVNP
ncbi:MAG: hypothetical protein PHQ40_12335 [Anaerolineaceae bacterium]|nr:hypothetical protein [Anaerolineaceae bacterium]